MKPVSNTALYCTGVREKGDVAMLLASLGLYGVMALIVSQRTRELGGRLSLGATARDVVTLTAALACAAAASGVRSQEDGASGQGDSAMAVRPVGLQLARVARGLPAYCRLSRVRPNSAQVPSGRFTLSTTCSSPLSSSE